MRRMIILGTLGILWLFMVGCHIYRSVEKEYSAEVLSEYGLEEAEVDREYEVNKDGEIILITFRDTTPPEIILVEESEPLFLKDTQLCLPFFYVTDNYDKEPEVTISGLDAHQCGIYTLTITAEDQKGNTSELTVAARVIREKKEYEESEWITYFMDEESNVALAEDKIGPMITLLKDSYEVNVNEILEIEAEAYDYFDDEYKEIILSQNSFEKAGEYTLILSAEDDSGNISEVDVAVTVNDPVAAVYPKQEKPVESPSPSSASAPAAETSQQQSAENQTTTEVNKEKSNDLQNKEEEVIVIQACPGGLDPSKPCDWIIDGNQVYPPSEYPKMSALDELIEGDDFEKAQKRAEELNQIYNYHTVVFALGRNDYGCWGYYIAVE